MMSSRLMRFAPILAPRMAPTAACRFFATPMPKSDMDVIDYLLKVEQDGEAYYRDLAAKAPNKGFARIFTMLADDEARHYKAIEQIQHSGESSRVTKTTICATTKSIFEKLQADPDAKLLEAKDQMALYAKARDIEAANRDEYIQRAKDATDPKLKALFTRVAAEEEKHFVMLDELIQFIGKAEPGTGRWTESAEYTRLDDELYDKY